jgi:hypothetical protein
MTLFIMSTCTCGQPLVKTPVKTLCLRTLSGTFAAFSKFHLNTSKSANIKVVHLFEGHTFHNWWHLRFGVEIGEILSQTQLLLFTSTMKTPTFRCSLCSNDWVKHHMAIVNVVEGNLLYDFGTQSFEVWFEFLELLAVKQTQTE